MEITKKLTDDSRLRSAPVGRTLSDLVAEDQGLPRIFLNAIFAADNNINGTPSNHISRPQRQLPSCQADKMPEVAQQRREEARGSGVRTDRTLEMFVAFD